MTGAVDPRVRAAGLEARFSLAVTLIVCIWVEYPSPEGVAMAVVLPVAMAFSVHGLHNAAGLGSWNLLYIPLRAVIILAGLAYSYSHYVTFLGPVEVAGADIRWAVALVVELLTITALVAHQAHTTRVEAVRQVDEHESNEQATTSAPLPADDELPAAVTPAVGGSGLGVPLLAAAPGSRALSNGTGPSSNHQ